MKCDETATFTDEVSLRRVGDPQDIANAALFLASDRSMYVTPESTVVDGGWWYSR